MAWPLRWGSIIVRVHGWEGSKSAYVWYLDAKNPIFLTQSLEPDIRTTHSSPNNNFNPYLSASANARAPE